MNINGGFFMEERNVRYSVAAAANNETGILSEFRRASAISRSNGGV